MKKLIALVLVVMLMVAMAVPSFAYSISELPSGVFKIQNEDFYIGELQTSKLNATQKAFMQEWLSTDSGMILCEPKSNILTFAIVKNGSGFKYEVKALPTHSDGPATISIAQNPLGSSKNLRMLHFNLSDLSPKNSDVVTTVGNVTFSYLISSSYLNNNPSQMKGFVSSTYIAEKWNRLIVYDDGGLLGEAPPDPDPGSGSSSESNSGGGEVVIPPADGVYVTYDTSTWSRIFLPYMKMSIGSSTDAGLSILAIIMGILVVIMIVRKFSKA